MARAVAGLAEMEAAEYVFPPPRERVLACLSVDHRCVGRKFASNFVDRNHSALWFGLALVPDPAVLYQAMQVPSRVEPVGDARILAGDDDPEAAIGVGLDLGAVETTLMVHVVEGLEPGGVEQGDLPIACDGDLALEDHGFARLEIEAATAVGDQLDAVFDRGQSL